MTRLSNLVFRNFWISVALAGGLGEWTLACWLFGAPDGWLVHLAAVAALTAINRLGAGAFDRERHTGPVRHTVGSLILATAIVAVVGAAALGVAAAGWLALTAFIAFPAQAGALEPAVGLRFGAPFDALAGATVAMAMAVAAWGYTHGHRRLRVTRLDVAMRNLPAELDGLRIAHITDLHFGPTASRDALREVFDRVNALDCDLVCVTGDLVDSPRTDLEHWLPELRRLRARHGIYAVLGNHDRYAGADCVAAALRAHTSWTVLRDEIATVEIDGGRLHLVGLEDRAAPHTADMLPSVLATVPADEPSLLLVHQPVVFPTAAKLGVPLTLSGHTHGGQIAVPGLRFLNPARFMMTRFDAGTFAEHGALLHVNLGLGTSGQRLRIAAPREITVVTLLSTAAAAAA